MKILVSLNVSMHSKADCASIVKLSALKSNTFKKFNLFFEYLLLKNFNSCV